MRRLLARMYAGARPVKRAASAATACRSSGSQIVSYLERTGIAAASEGPSLLQEAVQRRLVGDTVVIPGRGRIGRQDVHIGLVVVSKQQADVENRRHQGDPVELDALVREHVAEPRGAKRAIAFADQIFGAVPAAVDRQPALNRAGESVEVVVDADKILRLGLAEGAREPGGRSIDEHEVADVEQGIGIGRHPERSRPHHLRQGRVDLHRPE